MLGKWSFIVTPGTSGTWPTTCRCGLARFEGFCAQRSDRQRNEGFYPLLNFAKVLLEYPLDLRFRSRSFRRICQPPMSLERWAEENRAGFAGSAIANGNPDVWWRSFEGV